MAKAGKKEPAPARERLRGLIDADGAGVVLTRVGRSMVPHLGLYFVAWRSGEGPVSAGERRCDLVLAKSSDLGIDPYTIIEVEIAGEDEEAMRLPPSPDPAIARVTRPTTWLARIVAQDVPDADLERIRDTLRKPVRLSHPVLGDFEYDRSLRSYQGRIDWDGRALPLSLLCPDPKRTKTVLKHVDAVLAAWPQWRERAPLFAADKLLALKNGEWRDEDDDGNALPPITRDEFAARLVPESVDIAESGRVTVWFEDGDLFFGHAVHVAGKADGKLGRAGIAG
jgi:hypothetical protein